MPMLTQPGENPAETTAAAADLYKYQVRAVTHVRTFAFGRSGQAKTRRRQDGPIKTKHTRTQSLNRRANVTHSAVLRAVGSVVRMIIERVFCCGCARGWQAIAMARRCDSVVRYFYRAPVAGCVCVRQRAPGVCVGWGMGVCWCACLVLCRRRRRWRRSFGFD